MDAFALYFKGLPWMQIGIVVSVWMMVVGVIVFLYSSYLDLTRKKSLERYGLKTKVKESNKERYVEAVNDFFSGLISLSDSEVKEKLAAAGFYSDTFAKLLIPIKYIGMLLAVVGVAVMTMTLGWSLKNGLVLGLVLVVAFLLGPDIYLGMRVKAMQKKLSDRLPYLIDMMAICVQTGMTIEASISYLANEMRGFDNDIATMLQKTSEKARVVGLESALDDLYKRVPTPEFRSFVMTLSQSIQYGSSISQILTNLALDIREVQMLGLEERIGALSAKMSIPLILFIMIPIVILITAPGIMRLMG